MHFSDINIKTVPLSGTVCEDLEGFVDGFSTFFIESRAQTHKTRAIWKNIEAKFNKTTKFGSQ